MISRITPPPELEQQWRNQWMCHFDDLCPAFGHDYQKYVIAQAYQWGWEQRGAATEAELQQRADQELEACCEWISGQDWTWTAAQLRAARRPKPPSSRKQAYDALDTYIYGEPDPKDKERTYNTIRRALNQLPDE